MIQDVYCKTPISLGSCSEAPRPALLVHQQRYAGLVQRLGERKDGWGKGEINPLRQYTCT